MVESVLFPVGSVHFHRKKEAEVSEVCELGLELGPID
jgi:hypothetical protein